MKKGAETTKFPKGWDDNRVKRVLKHYEAQSEDEAAFEVPDHTVIEIPIALLPAVRELIAKHKAA